MVEAIDIKSVSHVATKRPARGEATARHLLEVTISLIKRKGLEATTIEDIIMESGVARMTIYNHFASKDGLMMAALQHETRNWREWFFARLADPDMSAHDRILHIFDVLAEWFERSDYCGCVVTNVLLIERDPNEALQALACAHSEPVMKELTSLAQAAGARNPEVLAEHIALLMNGAMIMAVIRKSVQPAHDSKIMAKAVLKDALPPGYPLPAEDLVALSRRVAAPMRQRRAS